MSPSRFARPYEVRVNGVKNVAVRLLHCEESLEGNRPDFAVIETDEFAQFLGDDILAVSFMI